jgi:hypothetical protein
MAGAAAAARAEQIARCAVCMPDYKHNGSTVEEQKRYAECVKLVHPEAFRPSVAAKAGVGLALLLLFVFVIGGWLADFADGAMMGFVWWAFSCLVIGGLWFAFAFLLS